MAYEIFLEDGRQLDLPDEGNIAISYQVNDIGDVKNQKANFSNRIKIPSTKNNLQVLGFNNSPASIDNTPYRQLSVRVIQDGEEIVSNGLLNVRQSTTTGQIEGVVFSGLIDFYSLIEGKSIRDLDFSEFDHVWDTGIKTKFNSVDGICYPLINYGALPEKEEEVFGYNFDVTQMFFSIYAKEIITKIFESVGLNFEGSFVDSEEWNNILIPSVQGFYTDANDQPRHGLKASGLANPGAAGTFNPLIILSNFEKEFDSFNNYNELTGEYSFSKNIRGFFRASGNINNPGGTLKLRFNSDNKGDITENQEFNAAGDFSFETEEMIFEINEVVTLEYESNTGVSIDLVFEFVPSEQIVYNSIVVVSENLPDIDQKDFMKDIAALTGLILEEDDETRTVKLRFFDDIEENKPFAVDWSDKLDTSKDPSMSFNFGFARTNYLNYSNDDTITAGENFAQGTIIVDDENLKVKDDLVTVDFSASEMKTTLRFLNCAQIPVLQPKSNFTQPSIWAAGNYSTGERVVRFGAVYEATANTTDTPSATSDNWQILSIDEFYSYEIGDEPNPRILLGGRSEALASVANIYNALDPADTDTIESIINPYFSLPEEFTFNLDFPSLITTNYRIYDLALFSTKVVSAYFYLKPEDIKKLDFLTPVYVSRFSSLFYVNRVNQFIRNRSTKVTLIRI